MNRHSLQIGLSLIWLLILMYRVTLKGSMILLPLLGLTWVIGLFAINQNTTVFAWLFTIVNSLQA